MTDVVLSHTSGGIINQTLVDDLRGEAVAGDAKPLAEVAGFAALDGTPPRKSDYETDFEAAFQTARAMWTAHADELAAGIDTSRLRERLVLPMLRLLGFDPTFQKAHLAAGDGTFRIPHLGWDGTGAPPIIIEPSDLDRASEQRSAPHDELQRYLNAAPASWGIVCNGRALRVLRDFHHTRTKGFVEFDLVAIFTASSLDDFRALWRLAHASRFLARPDPTTESPPSPEEPHAHCLLEQLHQKSVSAGVSAGRRLKPQVRRAIERLANGAIASTPALRDRILDDAAFGRALYGELLTVLYRMLFLLFAEQRDMLRSATSLYDETYSMSRLRQVADERAYEGRRSDLWEGLKTTFDAFHDPAGADVLGVYPFNGHLFDPTHTPNLTAAAIRNSDLAAAVRSLTTVQTGKLLLHVDYRNLGVEELGAVYESLLDYTLRVATTHLEVEGRNITPGNAYLNPFSTERADLASYYTPPDLVSLTLDKALDPLIAERLATAGADQDERVAALLDLRIIDNACGSAAFLIGVVDRLALAVAEERCAPTTPADDDVAEARRDVLSNCIYGADKDPFAVELAKVALWIHCAVPNAPLSFLDHHIVCGDSLVGWPMFDLPDTIATDAFEVDKGKVDKDTHKILKDAANRNNDYLAGIRTLFETDTAGPDTSGLHAPPVLASGGDSTFTDVRAKAKALAEYHLSTEVEQARAAADLWVAAHFWTADMGPAPITRDYHRAINGTADPDLLDAARQIVEPLNPLHWPIEFPDVHHRGGFDLATGNPPWEQFESGEIEFFRDTRPDIASLTSETRHKVIKELAEDPATLPLHDQWQRYRSAQDRMAWWAKICGRFFRTSGKTNTYILFTELAATLTRDRGRVGLVVKTGIAADEGPAELWERYVTDGRVRSITDIVNSGPDGTLVFQDVAAVERFSVLALGPTRDTTAFDASMLNYGVQRAAEAEPFGWDLALLAEVNPNTRTLPSPASTTELELLIELHRRNPILGYTGDDATNPWNLTYHQFFNSTNAKKDGLLLRGEKLEADGWSIQPDRTMTGPDGELALPVYEGQMANIWDHRARTFEGFAGKNKYGRKPHLPWVTEQQHADPAFEVEPRYWMREQAVRGRLDETVGDRAIVAFRDVTRVSSDRRSMKACLFPRYPATHTLPVFSVPVRDVFCALAILNSLTFDFCARNHMPGGHLTNWLLSQIPAPDTLPPAAADLAQQLSVTSTSVATSYGLSISPWNGDEREAMKAELDVLVATAYGVTRDEYVLVLDHFDQLHRLETKDETIGEARTRRLCLEAWDRLAKEGTI